MSVKRNVNGSMVWEKDNDSAICDECPAEGFKVFKRIVWGLIIVICSLSVYGTTAFVVINKRITDMKVTDTEVHTRNTLKVDNNEKAIANIVETLNIQTRAFVNMQKALIKLEQK